MSLATGAKLGPFEILSVLGAGGMGEVYRARDTRLNRTVAIKVLPAHLSSDPDLKQRFEREAKAISSLNHPHICTLFDVGHQEGVDFLVMEYLEGETLAERLRRGPLQIDEALSVCVQITEGVEAAHEAGVIHRDLKPGNVMLRADGSVKVLDFGLAQSSARIQSSSDPSHSPTLSVAATESGVLLGTAAYMSPEQARGKSLDRRTDIWSFGCVLFECLTGQQAFCGETISDTMAAILRGEPEWKALPAKTPPRIRKLLRRCLEKDPKQRLRDLGDAQLELLDASSEPFLPAGPAHGTPWNRLGLTVAGAALAGAVLIGGVLQWRSAPPEPAVHLVVNDTAMDLTTKLAISSDGRMVAYAGSNNAGNKGVWVRALDRFESTLLPGTESASNPFFSPDVAWIGFSSSPGLVRIPLGGGPPQLICPAVRKAEADWAADDTIVFWGGEKDGNLWPGLMRVSASGGTPEVVTSVDANRGETKDGWPTILPDGDTVLFTAKTKDGTRIDAVSLRSKKRRTLLEGGAFPRYSPAGYLFYWMSPTMDLLAAPFDAKRLRFTGSPIRVLQGVTIDVDRAMSFDISRNGTLIYLPAQLYNRENRAVWVDRQGVVTPAMDTVDSWIQPRISPDGDRLLLRKLKPDCDLWMYDLRRQVLTRLTFANDNHDPVWTPDGKRVTFDIPNGSPTGLVWQPVDGSGKAELLAQGSRPFIPSSWSPDGKTLAMTLAQGQGGYSIWMLPMDGPREARLFFQKASNLDAPVFSPDGHYLAYASDESGRSEVYISAYPGPGSVTQVSAEGGKNPLWSRDGRELFYWNENKVMEVGVSMKTGLSMGIARELFAGNFSTFAKDFDIMPDGKRFIMLQPVGKRKLTSEIHVLLHFSEELKRLASAGEKR